MRFSTLTLFIALPAAAYAAVAPVNNNCIQQTVGCVIGATGLGGCCDGLQCKTTATPGVLVCFMAHLLRFTLFTELNAAMPPLIPPAGVLELSRMGDAMDTEKLQVMVMMLGSYASIRRSLYSSDMWLRCSMFTLPAQCQLTVNLMRVMRRKPIPLQWLK